MAIGSSAKSVILIYFDASLALVAPPHRRTPPGELGTHKIKPRELRQRAETVRTRVYVDHKQQRSISTIHAPRRRLPPITSLPHSDLPNCTRGAKSSLGISAALVDAFRPLNHYAQNVRKGRISRKPPEGPSNSPGSPDTYFPRILNVFAKKTCNFRCK